MGLYKKLFKEIDINDPFFSSLKEDYKEFPIWFAKKSNEEAYVFYNDSKLIDGFLYLKYETDALTDVNPVLPEMPRIKVGTMKINPHGTRLGERFVKKFFDHALYNDVREIYVTVFPYHEKLISLYKRYGFEKVAFKDSPNGKELVLVRRLERKYKDVLQSYPFVKIGNNHSYLLAIEPRWHTRLLPDSILKNENTDIVQDISHTNSIHKVYLANMRGLENLQPGDNLLIYRMTDGQGPAYYRAVATSICAVEEYRPLDSFRTHNEFFRYCRPYSVFTDKELLNFWQKRKFRHVIRFTYNIALKRRVTRGEMIDKIGLDKDAYWGFMALTDKQFVEIAHRGKIDESLVIHQA